MSLEQIALSSDVRLLIAQGYEIQLISGYLVVSHVPYLNSHKQVKYGSLVTQFDVSSSKLGRVAHTMYFQGEMPCDERGDALKAIYNPTGETTLVKGLVADRMFSAKPEGNYYKDYHHKVTTYIAILSGPVETVDANASAKTYKCLPQNEEETVFRYHDTNSLRANLFPLADKLKNERIAIIGLGGTGSYILDFIAKTPVSEIHLFDDDLFLQHNAFRAPGACSQADLEKMEAKVHYFAHKYSKIRTNIFPHKNHIDSANLDELGGMTFVFISIDKGAVKKKIIAFLLEKKIPFIDVGIGMELNENKLLGSLRITTGTEQKSNHIEECICFSDNADEIYTSNVQIAELNALNAALAVVKWKKLRDFYHDSNYEHNTTFTLSNSQLLNEDISSRIR